MIPADPPAGVCTACGEGRRPVVDRRNSPADGGWSGGIVAHPTLHKSDGRVGKPQIQSATITGYACACPQPTADTTPSLILDPFGGTGTVAMVARALGRHGIHADLSADYNRLAHWRITDLDHSRPSKATNGRSGSPTTSPPCSTRYRRCPHDRPRTDVRPVRLPVPQSRRVRPRRHLGMPPLWPPLSTQPPLQGALVAKLVGAERALAASRWMGARPMSDQRIWPVRDIDRNDVCIECEHPFADDTHYATVPVARDSMGALVYDSQSDMSLVTCLGCAVAIGLEIQEISP